MEKRKMIKIISISCCIFLLTACQITKKNDASAQKESLQTPEDKQVSELILPEDIEAELYAELTEPNSNIVVQEKRIDISARDVDARLFFASIISDSEYSVAIHPDVVGEITLSLKQVTLAEALRVIEDMYGYEIKLKGRVYYIYPAGMRVASFKLDYLFMNRGGSSRTTVLSDGLTDNDESSEDSESSSSSSLPSSSSSSSGDDDGMKMKELEGKLDSGDMQSGTEISTVTSTNYWAYLEYKIKTLLDNKKGRDVIISPMSGVVTIRAYPNEIRVVREFLETETDNLTRQVILEMQIIEVTLSDEYQQGVSWSNVPEVIGTATSDVLFSSTSKLADSLIRNTIGGGGAIAFTNGDFSSVVSLLATQGDVNVLSKPRITAMNNQKAIIKVGGDEYFVTDVSTTTVTGTATTSTPNVELTPFFAGISVDVTPKINDDDSVLLHIRPSIVDIEEQIKTISFGTGSTGDLTIPVAKSDVRESDTVVKANSGEVIVIGGLMKTIEKDLVSKVPFIGDIPWLGEFFTNRQKVNYKTELVILVKPQVVKNNTWKQEIQKSSDLIEKWYPTK
jgi:MSHA biogenesis protein MshL